MGATTTLGLFDRGLSNHSTGHQVDDHGNWVPRLATLRRSKRDGLGDPTAVDIDDQRLFGSQTRRHATVGRDLVGQLFVSGLHAPAVGNPPLDRISCCAEGAILPDGPPVKEMRV